jgi:hypothetical protein
VNSNLYVNNSAIPTIVNYFTKEMKKSIATFMTLVVIILQMKDLKEKGKSLQFKQKTHYFQRPIRLAENGCELILADGRTIGHRSFKTYYQQKIRAPENRDSVLINTVISQYRLLGWTGSNFDSSSARLRQNPFHERERAHFQTRLGIKNNNQKHHREQIM